MKPELQADIEALKTPPRNRVEAKRQLAIKLRLLKSGALTPVIEGAERKGGTGFNIRQRAPI